jgi:hypothetical protein
VKRLDRHHRIALAVADADVVEPQNRERQELKVDVAGHPHRLAKDAARLGLEAALEAVPVDEGRNEERGEQQKDDGAAEDEIDPMQIRLRTVSLRGSCPGS